MDIRSILSGIDKMTEKAAPDEIHADATLKELATTSGAQNIQPANEIQEPSDGADDGLQTQGSPKKDKQEKAKRNVS